MRLAGLGGLTAVNSARATRSGVASNLIARVTGRPRGFLLSVIPVVPSPVADGARGLAGAGVGSPADDECSTLDDTPPWTLDNTDWALYPEVEPGESHTGTLCFPGIASEQIEYVVLEDNETYLIEPVGADAASVEIRITARRLADGGSSLESSSATVTGGASASSRVSATSRRAAMGDG